MLLRLFIVLCIDRLDALLIQCILRHVDLDAGHVICSLLFIKLSPPEEQQLYVFYINTGAEQGVFFSWDYRDVGRSHHVF